MLKYAFVRISSSLFTSLSDTIKFFLFKNFTKFFYKSILNQSTVCDAFKSTKNFVKNQYKNYESDRFTLLTNDCSPSCSYINKKSKEKGGQFMCLSDHVQVKSVPIMAKSETYKEVKDSHTQKVFNREKML